MSTNKGLIHFPNGDKFKGKIDRGQRNGAGEYNSGDGKMIFEGSFREDLRDGPATLTLKTNKGLVMFKGEYLNDKRHGKCEELSHSDL